MTPVLGLESRQLLSTLMDADVSLLTSSVPLGDPHPNNLISTRITYDDVFRESGARRSTNMNALRELTRMQVKSPIGLLLLEVEHHSAKLESRPFPDNRYIIENSQTRYTVGRIPVTGDKWIDAAGHISGWKGESGWLPGYTLAVLIRPWENLHLGVTSSSKPVEYQFSWEYDGGSSGGILTNRLSRNGCFISMQEPRLGMISAKVAKVGFNASNMTESTSGVRPEMSLPGWRIESSLKIHRPESNFSLDGMYVWQSLAGDSELYYDNEYIGRTGVIDIKEVNYQLRARYEVNPGMYLSGSYHGSRLAFNSKGHFDVWPFSDSNLFDQLATLYFVNNGTARMSRYDIALGRDNSSGSGWAAKLGLLRIIPDNELRWWQQRFIFFPTELTIEQLKLISAEILAPELLTRFVLGNIRLTISFAQAVPIKVKTRKPTEPAPPRPKTTVRGGSYPSLQAEYNW